MLTPLDLFRAARAMVRITVDPTNLDEVFVLADMSEKSKRLDAIVAAAKSDPRFQVVMRDKPRLGAVDLDELIALPEGTVGHAYASFMRARGHDHDDLILVDGESDLDFLRNHLRETHDLWHVATGFDTDVAGELGLQAFYMAQFSSPLPVLLLAVGMLNTLFQGMSDADRRMNAIARGWLLGRRGDALFGLRWRDRLEQPLAAFRRELALDLEEVDAIVAERGASELMAFAA